MQLTCHGIIIALKYEAKIKSLKKLSKYFENSSVISLNALWSHIEMLQGNLHSEINVNGKNKWGKWPHLRIIRKAISDNKNVINKQQKKY